jgi:uncharacterized protein YecT (DUF1311 family)
MNLTPKLIATVTLSLITLQAGASCIETVSDERMLEVCAKAEIHPLEEKVTHEFNRLLLKFKDAPELITILQLGKNGWDGYRNNQCFFEGAALSGKLSGVEAQRPLMMCVKRTLELRIKELEKL